MTEAAKQNVKQKLVNLTIDEIAVSVPEGTLVVDAAKMTGVDIPVFCYHPKMEPVGMCRMCLVDIGLPMRDRATGEAVLEADGTPKIQFAPSLQTGCTVRVSEGMVVVGYTEKVKKARQDVVEFLLTSHPLDCPICDKGGECPLQNLTMDFGTGESRFILEEKKRFAKNVPLGDLIFLDRERCIQCARCTRFQSEIAGDAVIGFNQRGRSLEIVTFSDPGFDSYWSGNTTDICPVGALTTADFRFGARPWELQASASICSQCAVGCNITLNTRREAKSGGDKVIKRVMPRQNEAVNEIWICDKGRFSSYQYTESLSRLTQPLIRKNGKLTPARWEEALKLAAGKMKEAGKGVVTLAGGRLSNEDYFNLNSLTTHLGGKARLYSEMGGGDWTAKVGVGAGTNFADMGAETAILVIASDLEEEAPLYWLRVKQAAERGAALVVANPRRTKLDRQASITLRYAYGEETSVATALLNGISPKLASVPASVKELAKDKAFKAAVEALTEADNVVVLYGSEGTSLSASQELAQACANLLIAGGHTGRPNNGLIAVWDKGNAQGAWDNGLQPSGELAAELKAAKVAYIAGANPAGDDPALAKAVDGAEFVIVQETNLTATAELADVVFPVRAFTEREGSYTSGERRVQRFYPAVPAAPGLRSDFGVTAELAAQLGLALEKDYAVAAFEQLAAANPAYADVTYAKMAETQKQWPVIGRDDVYYGGTTYDNTQGLGVQIPSAADRGEDISPALFQPSPAAKIKGLQAVPVTRLLDQGSLVSQSQVLTRRLGEAVVVLHPDDAAKLKVTYGDPVSIQINNSSAAAVADLDNSLPKGTVLVPRSLGMPISGPSPITVKAK